MATSWYAKALREFGKAGVSWESGSLKAVLVDTALYTVDFNAHEFLSSIAAGARVATVAVAGNTVADGGVCDATDTTWPNVTGPTIEAVVFYIDTGAEGTSRLLLYVDNSPDFPIPAPTGQDVVVRWSDGANKIARL